jgi:beta-lactamase class A
MAAPMTSASSTGQTGPVLRGVLVSLMTRSQSLNQNADPLQPLIAELTRSVLPWPTGQD